MRMSWQPRVFKSVNTFSQNLAPSVCSIQMPEDVATAVGQEGEREIDGFAADGALVAHLDAQGIEEHHRIHRLERALLPGGDLGVDRIGDRANQIGRDLHGIHLGEEGLNLAHGQPARVEGEDLVVRSP